jgi:3alpha(or 20beta)-hydroxysteroid dehydrogenase
MERFTDWTVIVTGAARGMGASHARGFVAEGANVVIADMLDHEGRSLAGELGDHAIFSRLDVPSAADWAGTVTAAENAFGPVSVLVNNAGIVHFGTIEETDPAAWSRVIDINLTGNYLGMRAIVSSMRKAGGGAIVNISSTGGMSGAFGLAARGETPAAFDGRGIPAGCVAPPSNIPDILGRRALPAGRLARLGATLDFHHGLLGAYVASKWGVRGLTKTAALELARDGIRVNSIHPGIRTTMAAEPDPAAMIASQ